MARTGDRGLRLRKRELFGYLGYVPHAGQILVHRSKASRRVLACGTRWGKSTAAAMEVAAALMAPCERSLGWIVAPTYDLAERVYSQVRGIMHARLGHRLVEDDERGHKIVLRNLSGGLSEVRAKSADRPASLLGEALDWLVLDEAARVKREIWDAFLSPRLVDRRGWALLLSTPRGRDWFYKAWRRGQKRRDPDYESWCSASRENPHLDRDVIEAERARLPADVFDQEWGAVFIGAEIEPCDTCGGPSPRVPGCVTLNAGEELAECPECGKPVDDDGKTLVGLWPNGVPHLSQVILHRGPANQQVKRAMEAAMVEEERGGRGVVPGS